VGTASAAINGGTPAIVNAISNLSEAGNDATYYHDESGGCWAVNVSTSELRYHRMLGNVGP